MKQNIIFLIVIQFSCIYSRVIQLTQEDAQNVKNSYLYLNNIQKSNDCAHELIKDIQVECKDLSEEQKSRLSLNLTNCLLIRSKKSIIPCPLNISFEECSQNLTGDSWNTYSSFYMHIDNLCFYYQAINWQRDTQKLISDIIDNSDKANILIQEALSNSYQMKQVQSDIHNQMKDHYKLSTEANQQIKESNESLENLKKSVGSSFDQITTQIISQSDKVGQVLSDLFDGLNEIKSAQQWIAANFFDLTTFIFYFGFSILLLLITSFKKFYSSRSFSLLMLWISFITERLFLRNEIFISESFSNQTIFRFFLVMIEIIILGISFKSYKDFNKLNYKQIQDLHSRLNLLNSAKIKQKIKSCLLSLTKDMKRIRDQHSPIRQNQKEIEFK